MLLKVKYMDYILSTFKLAGQSTYMKNWEPFVLGPLLAIDSRNGLSCLTVKSSSARQNSVKHTNRAIQVNDASSPPLNIPP